MTTTFRLSKFQSVTRKPGSENKKLSLFSPLALLVLLAIVFTFFFTASGDTGYLRDNANSIKNTLESGVNKSGSETMYRNIVTNGDAIRSVLQ
jgi:hypothetical protein